MKELSDYCIKRVALYLRLSKEDFDKNFKGDVSESIKNQKLMLINEVKKHSNWKIVGIFCDEDFSGAGTYRPEFENMIKLCEDKEIDIVLCKSQSRFSRDMEVIEKYLHNKFQEWNIRFVSLVDNADTCMKGNKKSRQINALVNEWYLEDLSNNIKTTLKTKWLSGECTSSFAKYGFMKDKKNKNHLVIDPVASEVIKQIGEMFLLGYGQDKIANILEENKIPSPYEYKLMNGCKLKLPISKNEDNKIISKAGTYIVKIYLYNNYRQILNNIKTIYKFIPYECYKPNNVLIKIRYICDGLRLFYMPNIDKIVSEIDINCINFDDSSWKFCEINDIISDKCLIGSIFSNLDRLNELYFELEVTVKKSNNSYRLFTKSMQVNNSNINFEYEVRKKYRWSGQVIHNMLCDESYNGALIQGKTMRVSYKNHKCVKTDKSQWIKVENAVEKIFDDDTWKRIQDKISKKSRTCSIGMKHLFSGKVYCNSCGKMLHKNSSSNKSGIKIEYLLCKNKLLDCDNRKSIRILDLKDIVLKEFNKLLKEYFDYNYIKKRYMSSNIFDSKEDSFIREKKDIISKIKDKDNVFKRLYEDRILNVIDVDDFKMLSNKYKDEVRKLKERLFVVEKELDFIYEKKNNNDLILNYSYINNLTFELVDMFINNIRIGKLEVSSGVREIIITWNF